jgi:hypothetical protein
MNYQDYLDVCKEEEWKHDHLLPLLELEKAKQCAYKMAWARKLMQDTELPDNVAEGMLIWIKQQDNQRMTHMLEALDMARLSTGLGDQWNAYLVKQWTKDGSKLPKV